MPSSTNGRRWNLSAPFRRLFHLTVLPAIFAWLSTPVFAQGTATGAIEGRVFDSGRGQYLENARITVAGTNLEAFTGAGGEYRFVQVPGAVAKLTVFFTGISPQTETVPLTPGGVVRHDITLRSDPSLVKLPEFVVSSSREINGAAIAINEQRFATNIRNVIAADEFGPKGEGAIGEMLQYIPGIDIRTASGNAYSASLNGVPTDYVPVTVNGFDLATAREEGSRQVVLFTLPTTHSVSRVEVLHSPTPESPGMALAGSINVVPLSAFERAKASFRASAFVLFRDDEPRTLNKTPGPGKNPTRKIDPGLNFTYVAPVSDRFGFTLSGGASKQYLRTENMSTTWRGVGTATTGTTFPDTTADVPYLTSYGISAFHQETSRQSLGLTVDYKLGPADKLSVSFNYVANAQTIYNPALTFAITNMTNGSFTSTRTRSAPGGANLTLTNNDRIAWEKGYTTNLVYRHSGPIWRATAGLGHSLGLNSGSNVRTGTFFNQTAQRNGVTLAFDDIFYLRPRSITVTDGVTGQSIDPYRLDTYVLASTSDLGDRTKNRGIHRDAAQRNAKADLARDFDWGVPVVLKVGIDVSQQIRDLWTGQTAYSFVGADGRVSTASPTPVVNDDSAAAVPDATNTLFAYGIGPVQLFSGAKLNDLYQANPSYFTRNDATSYRSFVSNSKYAEEVISAAFVRGDVHFFDHRLRLVGGVRAEQTNVKAEGPLTDVTRNYQRDAAGNVIRGANGSPLTITSDALQVAQLTAIERGAHVSKEYLRLFPSINLSYNLRPNLIARAAYYFSLGRPNFNQYSGGITLPDTAVADPSTQRITVNNAAIKAWDSKSTKLMLEYYFGEVGLLSVGAFRRDISNFFGSGVFEATPEFLAHYGLDPNLYGRYLVATQYNLPTPVRMEGYDVNYKQALRFLPHWARGVQVFANHSALRTIGDSSANFAGFVPRIYSWGFSVNRDRFNLKVNWNYRGRNRQSLVAAGRGIAPATFRWGSRQIYTNLSGEYYFYKRTSLFLNWNSPVRSDVEIAGPNTPSHAQLNSRQQYGGLWTVGINSTF